MMKQIADNLRLHAEKFFYINEKNPSVKKIKLAHNKPLTSPEFSRVNKLCDIFTAIADTAAGLTAPPDGGVFWSDAKGIGPFELHTRKNRDEINHSFLFNTRFRDFPSIAYELDNYTPSPDFWVRRYARLSNVVKKKWHVKVPAKFGEIGWSVRGYPVNRLTSINQERISAMLAAGVAGYLEQQSSPKIMEIGAGGGELGYVLCKALPNCTWYDCDLLGSLVYSALHLAVFLPKKRHFIYVGNLPLPAGLDEKYLIRCPKRAAAIKNAVINIPHFLVHDFKNQLKLHLAYNTYSFGEMPQAATENYVDLLSNFLAEKGILFEQNGYFPDREGHNVVDVLEKHFHLQPHPELLDPNFILNGAIRVWSNNSMAQKISTYISPFRKSLVLSSLENNQDAIDIHYPATAWDYIAKKFPSGI